MNINETFGNSITNISIRGLGLNDYAVNNNPAAGVYVDEVYLVSPAMLSFQLFDLERVEVLKGPQGTLYGRNTTAGAVKFISKKPTEEFNGYLSADYGRYDHFVIAGAAGGKIADGLTGRLSMQTSQRNNGYQLNRATGNKVGEIDRTSFRVLLNWQPSEDLDILLNVHGGYEKSDTLLVKVDNTFTDIDDGIVDPHSSSAGNDISLDNKNLGVSLTLNWALADELTLTSVTGYEDYERSHSEDRDGTTLVQLDGLFLNDIEQISQELRLTWVKDEYVLIGGVFYGHDKIPTRDIFLAPDLLPLFGANFAGATAIGNEYKQEADSYAIFGHAERQFHENWKFTLGLRYTDEDKEFNNAFTYLQFGGPDVQLFTPVNNDYSVSNLSGKAGIDYTGFENTLLYASFSRGFKSGNFQGQLTFNPLDLQPFDKELVSAYEIGANAIVIDCMGDPGMAACREAVSIPVLGPCQTAMHIASSLSHSFAFVTVLERIRPLIHGMVAKYGLEKSYQSFRAVDIPVLEIHKDLAKVNAALEREATKAVKEDGAESIIFGCTGFLGCVDRLKKGLNKEGIDVPVIDPVPLAVHIADSLVKSGLGHSKLTYPKPGSKAFIGYDIPGFSV